MNDFKKTATAVNAEGKAAKEKDVSRKNQGSYGNMNSVKETADAVESKPGSSKPIPG